MVRKRNNGMRENAPSKPPCEYIIQNDFGFTVVEMLNLEQLLLEKFRTRSSPVPYPSLPFFYSWASIQVDS